MTRKSDATYRYPGVVPFTTQQSHVFYGRSKEINLLFKMVSLYPITTLYSKSGLGKSSLINAGVIPKITDQNEYVPITIRFGAYEEGSELSLVDITQEALHSFTADLKSNKSINVKEKALWLDAKSIQLAGSIKPLFIFDQFEELFTYPDHQIMEFTNEISELLHPTIPQRIMNSLRSGEKISKEDQLKLTAPLESRILVSIRSDKLHLLDRIKNKIPGILKHTFELLPLSPENAHEAIVQPAMQEGNFVTPPFTYTSDALDRLIHVLKDERDGSVEGYFIQLLCEHYERNLIEKTGIKSIGLKEIGNINDVISNYYYSKINTLDPDQQAHVRFMIEDGLVSNEIRLSKHESELTGKYNVDKDLLMELVNNRLLRSTPFSRGGYTFELSHDRLVPTVLESKAHREAEEARQLEEAENARLREEAEKAKKEKEKADRQLFIFRMLTGGLIVACVIIFFVGKSALDAQKDARQANLDKFYGDAMQDRSNQDYEEAIAMLEIAKSFTGNKDTIESKIQEIEQEKLLVEQYQPYLELGDSLIQLKEYPGALRQFEVVFENDLYIKIMNNELATILNGVKSKMSIDSSYWSPIMIANQINNNSTFREAKAALDSIDIAYTKLDSLMNILQ